jgi:hypothetical protein
MTTAADVPPFSYPEIRATENLDFEGIFCITGGNRIFSDLFWYISFVFKSLGRRIFRNNRGIFHP